MTRLTAVVIQQNVNMKCSVKGLNEIKIGFMDKNARACGKHRPT